MLHQWNWTYYPHIYTIISLDIPFTKFSSHLQTSIMSNSPILILSFSSWIHLPQDLFLPKSQWIIPVQGDWFPYFSPSTMVNIQQFIHPSLVCLVLLMCPVALPFTLSIDEYEGITGHRLCLFIELTTLKAIFDLILGHFPCLLPLSNQPEPI